MSLITPDINRFSRTSPDAIQTKKPRFPGAFWSFSDFLGSPLGGGGGSRPLEPPPNQGSGLCGGARSWRAPVRRALPRYSLGAPRPFDSPWAPPSAKRPTTDNSEVGPFERLVEAGGVEPPSEDSLLRATTCVSGHLGLVPGDPGRQGSLRTIPGEGSPFGPPGGGFRLSRESDLLAPIRAFDGRRQAA
jgi:hypothetical protein